jgi:hypothetical protein
MLELHGGSNFLRLNALTAQKVKKGYKKRGQTHQVGFALKQCGFCDALLLGDQNLFGRDGSLSQFDILFRKPRRTIRQFHT